MSPFAGPAGSTPGQAARHSGGAPPLSPNVTDCGVTGAGPRAPSHLAHRSQPSTSPFLLPALKAGSGRASIPGRRPAAPSGVGGSSEWRQPRAGCRTRRPPFLSPNKSPGRRAQAQNLETAGDAAAPYARTAPSPAHGAEPRVNSAVVAPGQGSRRYCRQAREGGPRANFNLCNWTPQPEHQTCGRRSETRSFPREMYWRDDQRHHLCDLNISESQVPHL